LQFPDISEYMNDETMAKIKADTRKQMVIAKEYGISPGTVSHIKNGPKQRMLSSAKTRAKKKGLEFNLTLEDIVIPEYCPLLGIKLTNHMGTCRSKCGLPDSCTLDRKDTTKGYVKGNVWVISHKANTIKNNSTFDEFELIYNNWKTNR
jgi:hypothetical protein